MGIAGPVFAQSTDPVVIHADGSKSAATFAAGDNNELEQSSSPHGEVTTYTYDTWGRTLTAAQAGVTKTYSWKPYHMLAGVNSSDPAETDVFNVYYPGDSKRFWRQEGTSIQQVYDYAAGFEVSSEISATSPTTTATFAYVPGLAKVDVTQLLDDDPGTDDVTYRYITTDHLGSTRGMYNEAKQRIGSWEYTPYGEPFRFAGPPDVTQLYTGHTWDPVARLYYAPFRVYNPQTARWLSRDPLGMINGPNQFAYVYNNPSNFTDALGLKISISPNATEKHKKQTQQAIWYLARCPNFRALFKQLMDSPTDYVILPNNNKLDSFSNTTFVIDWDPTAASGCSDGPISPALNLAHEMGHAAIHDGDPWLHAWLALTPATGYDWEGERIAMQLYENPIARDLGETIRTNHHGDFFRVPNPTESSIR